MAALYDNALSVLERTAKLVSVPRHIIDALRVPQRTVEASIPVTMDDGTHALFTGYRVQHSNARGPFKGGIRFHPNVSLDEVRSLAFWMSMKTAVADIPFGGAKGGVIVDAKKLSVAELERLSRGYARGIAPIIGSKLDVPAPDVDTNAQVMSWIRDEYTKVTGIDDPAVITGKPIPEGGAEGRDEATGLGGFYILRELTAMLGLQPAATSVAVQGFGNVGAHFASFAHAAGFKIVAVSDSSGAVYNEHGLPIPDLSTFKDSGKRFADYEHADRLTNEALLELPVTVLAPAALEHALTGENAHKVRARAILELANGPTSAEADAIFTERKLFVVPDILGNAGGVTSSYFEWYQNVYRETWDLERARKELEYKMTTAWSEVKQKAEKLNVPFRTAAYAVALERIATAMQA